MSHPHPCRARAAFTFAEILIVTLILGMGFLSVITLTLTGIRDSTVAIGLATANTTAATALYDPKQVDPAKTAGDSPVSGFINGYYVVRTILSTSVLAGGAGSVDLVKVQVYWGESGTQLAGITSHFQR